MTFLENIKMRIFLAINAKKIYFALIEADLAINGSISGHQATSIDKSKTKLRSIWYGNLDPNEFWLMGDVRYFNGEMSTIHYNLGYHIPKEYVLTYKQYILYLKLSGKMNP